MDEKVLEAIIQMQQQVKDDPLRFLSYTAKPQEFCKEILGVNLWSKQDAILLAVRDNRRVAVKSGHGVGKSFALACLVLWWLYARQGLVITTAPTWESVESVLWREIHSIRSRAPVHLPGKDNITELVLDKTWYAIGLSTNMPSAFQGRHHPRLLVAVDEAAGVNEQVHLEARTLATGEQNRIVMIGNPTSLSGTFYDAFQNPDVWTCLTISCLEHPNLKAGKEIIKGAVTVQWVNDARRDWGENHPFWYSRVLGEFPRISNRGVIPLAWVEQQTDEAKRLDAVAQAEKEMLPFIGGLDVARYGENQSVLTIRRGDAIVKQEAWHHATLMETAGRAMRAIEDYNLSVLVVDANGIGAGVADRLVELGAPVYAYNGGHRAFTPKTFANRRSEMWWYLRERFEKGRIWLPKGLEKLTADLIAPEYHLSSAGRIQIETKEALLKRNVKSPDWGDSLVLCFAADEPGEMELNAPVPPDSDAQAWEEEFGPKEEKSEFDGLPGGAF